jgi:hypothetical protein
MNQYQVYQVFSEKYSRIYRITICGTNMSPDSVFDLFKNYADESTGSLTEESDYVKQYMCQEAEFMKKVPRNKIEKIVKKINKETTEEPYILLEIFKRYKNKEVLLLSHRFKS